MSIQVSSGILQGDRISSLLFLLFITDISSILKRSKILLLADNAKINRTIKSKNDALELQSDSNKLGNWSINNGLELK